MYAVAKSNRLMQDLAEAETIAEKKNVGAKAEAIRRYLKTQNASLEEQNHFAEVTLRSRRDIGQMIPSLVSKGNPQIRHDDGIDTFQLEELGISENFSARCQALAKIDDEKLEQYIADVKEKGEELTTAGLLRRVKNVPQATPHIISKNNEWYTPEKYIEAARKLMGGIDLDPASCAFANETVKAANYYDITQNGLDKSWTGRVWLNPPYGYTDGVSNQALWSSCLIRQYDKGNGPTTEAVLLVNAAVDTNWFHDLLADCPVCLTRGRVNFTTPDLGTSGSTHGSAFVYFGPNPERFVEIFSEFGTVVRKW